MWKDLVQTMEEEKESMERERETSLRLLEETQQRLASALHERNRIKKEASERNEKLTKRVQELKGRTAGHKQLGRDKGIKEAGRASPVLLE